MKKFYHSIKGNDEIPRLSVFKSNKHIYTQIIDDKKGITLVSCSTIDKEIKLLLNKPIKNCHTSYLIGEKIAERSIKKNINKIIFDRGRYIYHGSIKSLAEGMRKGGLQF